MTLYTEKVTLASIDIKYIRECVCTAKSPLAIAWGLSKIVPALRSFSEAVDRTGLEPVTSSMPWMRSTR